MSDSNINGKIMVTGGMGFIGRALVELLESRGYEVMVPSSNDIDVTNLGQALKANLDGVGYIIHLAGLTFVPKSWEEPVDFINANVLGTANMLELCRIRHIPMTYVSAYIYGQPKKNPIDESDPIQPNNPYALSKYLAEEICEFYAAHMGVKVNVVRPFNVYGPGQREDFVIPGIISQAKDSEDIRVLDLSPKRDYVYLKDLTRAICLAMEKNDGYDVFNIGSGQSYSVEETIAAAQKALGTNKPIICANQERKNEISDVRADISHAKEVLGWEPEYSLEEGLSDMAKELT